AAQTGTYTFRVLVSDGALTDEEEITVTVNVVTAPTLATTQISTIGSTSATISANISSDGGGAISERGIVWASTPSPTLANTKAVSTGTSTGIFNQQLTGLPAGSIIYARAYATNSKGTSYGQQVVIETFKAGDGTTSNPYQINTWGQLNNIRFGLSGHYKLLGNLDQSTPGYSQYAGATANGSAGWLPIGDDSNRFSGSLD